MAVPQYQAFDGVGGPTSNIVGGDLASAATIVPTAGIHKVTGGAAISNITPPFPGFQGTIYLIPTGTFTLATGGSAYSEIAIAATAVVSKVLAVTYVDNKWYPSYLS